LGFFKSKIDQGFAAAGVRLDRIRDPLGILHILGCMINFRLFRSLELDFLPDLPKHDVGDLISVKFRQNKYNLFACRNTLHEPNLVDLISHHSPIRNLQVDRSFDDDGNVVFLHLGRGIRKSVNENILGTTPVEWVAFSEGFLE
jgi:hypothetical protein